ncbi:MAG: inositol monophosphatase family protein [Desulfurivibrionaceae bacterium]
MTSVRKEEEDERITRCVAGCKDQALGGIMRTAGRAALAAGNILRSLYDQPHRITRKGAIDLVTEADVAAEQTVLAMLKEAGPGIGFLAEESHSSYETLPQGPVWVIDPLDGTTNFAHGFPIFAVSIAYAVGTVSKVGVVYAPMQDELFCACQGSGAWLNGRPIRVSSATLLQDSLLATGFPYAIATEVKGVMAALTRLLIRCQGVRRTGAAAVDLAYLACGRTDGFWEINLKPWDTAAAMLLVSEAGGRLTAYNGQGYTPYLPEVVASNGKIHAEMIGQLADFSRAGEERGK